MAILASTVRGHQTVARPQLWAATLAAQHAHQIATILIDNKYTVDGANAPKHEQQDLSNGDNGDPWANLLESIKDQQTVQNVTAHNRLHTITGNADAFDTTLNMIADAAAEDQKPHKHKQCIAQKIARRLAVLETERRDNLPTTTDCTISNVEEPAYYEKLIHQQMQEAIKRNGRQLIHEEPRIGCINCHRRAKTSSWLWLKTLMEQLRTTSPPIGTDTSRTSFDKMKLHKCL